MGSIFISMAHLVTLMQAYSHPNIVACCGIVYFSGNEMDSPNTDHFMTICITIFGTFEFMFQLSHLLCET